MKHKFPPINVELTVESSLNYTKLATGGNSFFAEFIVLSPT